MSDDKPKIELKNPELVDMMYRTYTAQMRWAGVDQDRITKVLEGWAVWGALAVEEKRRREKAAADEAEAARVSLHDENVNRWQAVCMEAGADSRVLAKVAGFHQPVRQYRDYDECEACKQEVSGYEYDMDEWPCATFLLIEEGTS